MDPIRDFNLPENDSSMKYEDKTTKSTTKESEISPELVKQKISREGEEGASQEKLKGKTIAPLDKSAFNDSVPPSVENQRVVLKNKSEIPENSLIQPGRAVDEVAPVNLGLEFDSLSSTIWEFTEVKPDEKSEGKIIQFTIKSTYDTFHGDELQKKERMDALIEGIYSTAPAVDLSPYLIGLAVGDDVAREEVSNRRFTPGVITVEEHLFKKTPIFKDLGFSFEITPEKTTVSIPDLVALKERWEEVRGRNPKLPELRIAYSDGIASDQEYIRLLALGEHPVDCIISRGKEFAHDMIHLISTIYRMINSAEMETESNSAIYEKGMENFRTALKNDYEILKIAQSVAVKLKQQNPQEDLPVSDFEFELALMSLGVCLDEELTTVDPKHMPQEKISSIIDYCFNLEFPFDLKLELHAKKRKWNLERGLEMIWKEIRYMANQSGN